MQLQTGTLLHQGEYRILSVLGQGGFGITYLGLQQGLERRVAIKEFFMKDLCNRNEGDSQVSVLSEGARQQVDRFRQKFLKEAKTLAALDNPHIIRIYNVFEENGTAYYVMEYIEDGSLKDLVTARGPLPEAEALGYIRQLADALGYLHRQKILHLDLKPANVLLKGGQTAVLIDFGISKRYDEEGSQTSSTPAGISRGYAPLEQYNAGGVSRFQPCTDIYSLGATLYTLLTGEVPPAATDVNNDGLPALPPHISAQTARAIEKAMSPRPKDRPQSVEEFLKLLESENEETTKLAKEETAPKEKEKTKTPKPRKLRKIIGGVVAAMVVMAGLLAIPFLKDAPKEAKEMDYTPLFTPYKNAEGKYGYVGITGKEDSLKTVVIPARYDYAFKFSEGLALIERNKKWGYINKLGEEVIPPQYVDTDSFQEELAAVKINERWGYIDKQGTEVISPQYSEATSFSEGFARIVLNKKVGYINKQGETVIPPKYDYANPFQEGLARIESEGKYGYINKQGIEIVPPQYDDAYDFREGLAAIRLNGKWGYINRQGEEVVPPKYDRAGYFSEGLAEVNIGEEWGFINQQGEMIIPPQYGKVSTFSEGLAKIHQNGGYGFVDKQGKEVVPPQTYNSANSFSEGLACVELNGKYGYINRQGKEVISCQYDHATNFCNERALVQTGSTCYFITPKGERILEVTIDGELQE